MNHELAESEGVTLRLARVKPVVLAVLRVEGFLDRIGADHVDGNVHRAVEAQLAEPDVVDSVPAVPALAGGIGR